MPRKGPATAPSVLWIIDAYNVIRRDPTLRALEQGRGTAEARAILESQLGLFRARQGRGHSVVLAYDGHLPPGTATRSSKGLRICYASPGGNADQVVVAEARRAAGRTPVRVVSSDRQDITIRLRGLEVRCYSVEEFRPLLWPDEPGELADDEKPDAPTGDEVDYWMRQFGEE